MTAGVDLECGSSGESACRYWDVLYGVCWVDFGRRVFFGYILNVFLYLAFKEGKNAGGSFF